MNNRVSYLDVFKGFGIFFVVFGHVTHIGILREYIWNFHMPLFFFVSGLLYKPNLRFKDFLLKRIKSIYIPYILFFLVTFCYWLLIERHVRGGEYSIWHQLFGLPYGTYEGNHLYFNGALWFLPCLFTTELLFYPISRINSKIAIISLLIISFTVGTILKMNNINYLPFGLHTAFFALIFYGIGYMSKEIPTIICNTKRLLNIIFIVACLSVQLLCIHDYYANINTCNLPYIPLAIIGIMLYLTLSIEIKNNKILEYIGKNSLVIFAFQEPVYRAVIYICSKILTIETEYVRNNLLLCIMVTAITITITIPGISFYNKYIRKKINALF